MAGNGQQSNEQATRNGIQALEAAFSGIMKSKQDVDQTRATLSSGYQGSDGGQFGSLLKQWDDQATSILRSLEDMVDKLNQSLSQHGKTQGSSNESINQAYSQSQAAFDQLAG
ncbi:WXG100 family type VII secretion target [Streptomyces sp. B21-083]|uniref:WXG100 family type VII secretion target n=1 Tax=Streptomyces sp. B21-083 TaxID=3039410 RepID=UPI002FF34CC9